MYIKVISEENLTSCSEHYFEISKDTFCRILGSEKKLAEARLALTEATKTVLQNGVDILALLHPSGGKQLSLKPICIKLHLSTEGRFVKM